MGFAGIGQAWCRRHRFLSLTPTPTKLCVACCESEHANPAWYDLLLIVWLLRLSRAIGLRPCLHASMLRLGTESNQTLTSSG